MYITIKIKSMDFDRNNSLNSQEEKIQQQRENIRSKILKYKEQNQQNDLIYNDMMNIIQSISKNIILKNGDITRFNEYISKFNKDINQFDRKLYGTIIDSKDHQKLQEFSEDLNQKWIILTRNINQYNMNLYNRKEKISCIFLDIKYNIRSIMKEIYHTPNFQDTNKIKNIINFEDSQNKNFFTLMELIEQKKQNIDLKIMKNKDQNNINRIYYNSCKDDIIKNIIRDQKQKIKEVNQKLKKIDIFQYTEETLEQLQSLDNEIDLMINAMDFELKEYRHNINENYISNVIIQIFKDKIIEINERNLEKNETYNQRAKIIKEQKMQIQSMGLSSKESIDLKNKEEEIRELVKIDQELECITKKIKEMKTTMEIHEETTMIETQNNYFQKNLMEQINKKKQAISLKIQEYKDQNAIDTIYYHYYKNIIENIILKFNYKETQIKKIEENFNQINILETDAETLLQTIDNTMHQKMNTINFEIMEYSNNIFEKYIIDNSIMRQIIDLDKKILLKDKINSEKEKIIDSQENELRKFIRLQENRLRELSTNL